MNSKKNTEDNGKAKVYHGGDFYRDYRIKLQFRNYICGNTPLPLAIGGDYARKWYAQMITTKGNAKDVREPVNAMVIDRVEYYRKLTGEEYSKRMDWKEMCGITAFPRTSDENENFAFLNHWIQFNLEKSGTQLGVYRTFSSAGLKDTLSRLSRISNLVNDLDYFDTGININDLGKKWDYMIYPGTISGPNGRQSIVSKFESLYQPGWEFGYSVLKSRAERITSGFDDLVRDLFIVGQEIGLGGGRARYGKFDVQYILRIDGNEEISVYEQQQKIAA